MNNDTPVPPAFNLRRFTCPTCDRLADQAWLNVYAEPVSNAEGLPLRIAGEGLEQLARNPRFPPQVRAQKVAYWNRVNRGEVFIDRWAPVQTEVFVAGMELSLCHACGATAVWLGGRLVHPVRPPGDESRAGTRGPASAGSTGCS